MPWPMPFSLPATTVTCFGNNMRRNRKVKLSYRGHYPKRIVRLLSGGLNMRRTPSSAQRSWRRPSMKFYLLLGEPRSLGSGEIALLLSGTETLTQMNPDLRLFLEHFWIFGFFSGGPQHHQSKQPCITQLNYLTWLAEYL